MSKKIALVDYYINYIIVLLLTCLGFRGHGFTNLVSTEHSFRRVRIVGYFLVTLEDVTNRQLVIIYSNKLRNLPTLRA